MCIDSYKVSSFLSPNAQEWIPTPPVQNAPFHPLQFLPHVIFAPHSPPSVQVVALTAPPPHKPYFNSLSFPSCYQSFIPYGPRATPQPFHHPAPVTFPATGCFYAPPPPSSSGGGKKLEKVEWPTGKSPKSPPVIVRRTCYPPRLQRTRMPFNVEKKPTIRRQVWVPKTSNFNSKVASGYGGAPSPAPASPSTPLCDNALPSEEFSAPSKSTVMIKNIPNKLRRDRMLEFLDQYCNEYSLEYDFLYLPMDFRKEDNLGYAFVNFTSAEAALKFKEILQDYRWDTVKTEKGLFKSKKICEITWAKIQGKEELVKRFQNTSFACNKLEFLPVVLDPPRNGSDPQPAPPMIIGRLQDRAFSKTQ
ncbi:hypothetical protein CDL12_20234 [Handroanthus impetiginosus]|uniref:Mei2-like C-terminal RNA recognition motif domain-containing protein n=1 Tax=Handroanthus impetiginosus TaxID=429701 RepID=A0A2G9GPI3_9LAMI|nr:hypothetical protein CDL12_20234 [Handroanthus impetiginosus]